MPATFFANFGADSANGGTNVANCVNNCIFSFSDRRRDLQKTMFFEVSENGIAMRPRKIVINGETTRSWVRRTLHNTAEGPDLFLQAR